MNALRLFVVGLLVSGLLGVRSGHGAAVPGVSRSGSGGGVTVKVTMLESKTDGNLSFEVMLDTHAVNLDGYDLKNLSILRDDAGNTYLPTTVENKGSGHHRQVNMVFAKMANSSKHVELVIKDIAGVNERTFRWDR